MALNTSHANNGVLLHAGETILLFCDHVTISWGYQRDNPAFKHDKHGRLYLTTHRIIFNNKKRGDPMMSFSFPFVAIKDVELEQPVFGANYIKGVVKAQPGGNFDGEAKFKLYFKSGGAVDFGQAMLRAAQMANRVASQTSYAFPPAYAPPAQGTWYAAPPPAYAPNPQQGYMGWVPPTNVFPERPPQNSVYMTDAPPPYPGINGYQGYAANAPGPVGGAAASAPPMMDAKAAEAMQAAPPTQNGWYDPNNPNTAYVPPQANEMPPSYEEAQRKKDD